jgi:CBS domain-containing protein/ribosome-associated translation inhibitor RaiA
MKTAGDILRKEYVRAATDTPVSQVLGNLVKHGADEAIIFDNDTVKGSFKPRLLGRSRIDVKEMKASHATEAVPHIEPDTPLLDVAKLMYTSNSTHLPVVDGSVQGVAHVHDVFAHLDHLHGDEMTIADIHSPKAVTIDEDAPVGKAISIMRKHTIDRLPVTSGGNVTGFLSYKDLVKNYYLQHQKPDRGHKPKIETKGFDSERHGPWDVAVKSFMHTGNIITAEPHHSLSDVAALMRDNDVMSVLVNDGDIRVVTKRDVLEAVTKAVEEIEGYIHYKGWEDLNVSEYTQKRIKKSVENYATKFQDYIDNEYELTVHVKQYDDEGTRAKYSVKSRLTFPGKTVASDKQHDWEFPTAIRKSMDAIETQLEKLYTQQKGRPTPRKE